MDPMGMFEPELIIDNGTKLVTVSPRRFACILTFSLQVKHWFAAQGLSISDPELLWKILVSQQQIDGRCGVLIWSFNQ